MASPFTAKQGHIMPCTSILKQGRSTLVTTVQMFKILGLLCLSTAYSLSVMYLQVTLPTLAPLLVPALWLAFRLSKSAPCACPACTVSQPRPSMCCALSGAAIAGGQAGRHASHSAGLPLHRTVLCHLKLHPPAHFVRRATPPHHLQPVCLPVSAGAGGSAHWPPHLLLLWRS